MVIPFNIPIRDIERTAEYESFMAKLDEYHQGKGTIEYTREPMLGGMRIDLRKLLSLVNHHGGFNKVTSERAWKKIADYFDFPPTCTNAAFVLKRVYVQSLKDFVNSTSRSGSPSLNQQGKSHEDTSSDEEIKKLYLNAGATGKKLALMDVRLKKRLLLSLRSRLPNEVSWAISELVPFSLKHENVNFEQIPDLLTELLYQGFSALKVFRVCDKTNNEFEYRMEIVRIVSRETGSSHTSAQIEMGRRKGFLCSILLILYNFSFGFANAKKYSQDPRIFSFLAETIRLERNAEFMECHKYVLGIIENMAVHINIFSMGPLLSYVVSFHCSMDVFFITCCYAILAKSMIMPNELDVTEMIGSKALETALSLLLVRDERTLTVIVEFWTQFIDFVLRSQRDFPFKLESLVSNLLHVCLKRSFLILEGDIFRRDSWLKSNYQISKSSSTMDLDVLYSLYAHYFPLDPFFDNLLSKSEFSIVALELLSSLDSGLDTTGITQILPLEPLPRDPDYITSQIMESLLSISEKKRFQEVLLVHLNRLSIISKKIRGFEVIEMEIRTL